jgi:hypothetical protein
MSSIRIREIKVQSDQNFFNTLRVNHCQNVGGGGFVFGMAGATYGSMLGGIAGAGIAEEAGLPEWGQVAAAGAGMVGGAIIGGVGGALVPGPF